MELLLLIAVIFFIYKWTSAKKETGEARILGVHREWFIGQGIDPGSVRYATYTGRPRSLTDGGTVYVGDGALSEGNRIGFCFEATPFGIAGEKLFSATTTSWHQKVARDSVIHGMPMETIFSMMDEKIKAGERN